MMEEEERYLALRKDEHKLFVEILLEGMKNCMPERGRDELREAITFLGKNIEWDKLRTEYELATHTANPQKIYLASEMRCACCGKEAPIGNVGYPWIVVDSKVSSLPIHFTVRGRRMVFTMPLSLCSSECFLKYVLLEK